MVNKIIEDQDSPAILETAGDESSPSSLRSMMGITIGKTLVIMIASDFYEDWDNVDGDDKDVDVVRGKSNNDENEDICNNDDGDEDNAAAAAADDDDDDDDDEEEEEEEEEDGGDH